MGISSVDELVDLVDHLESTDKELPWIVCDAIAVARSTVRVELDLRLGSTVHSRWLVVCSGAVEHRFSLGGYGQLSLLRNHFLLLDHTDRRAMLHFTGSATEPRDLAAKLTETHARVVGDWRPMSRYLNSHLPLPELLAGPGGLLASGPASVLAVYSETLMGHGLKPSTIDSGFPRLWDAERQWVERDRNVQLLLFSGASATSLPGGEPDSFVVAKEFEVRKLAGERGVPFGSA